LPRRQPSSACPARRNSSPYGADYVDTEDYNTWVYVTAPASLGRDTIFTDYTAPNVTPNSGGYTFPGSSQTVYWYFYGADGAFQSGASGSFALGPDETYLFDWRTEATSAVGGSLKNKPGYLVFANQSARGGGAATFAIEAKAYVSTNTNTFDNPNDVLEGKDNFAVPTLALADGADGGSTPVIGNEVIYESGNVPTMVSPIVSGLRQSASAATTIGFPLLVADGDYNGNSRRASTMMVLWLDEPGPASRPVSVVDSLGNTCDATVDLSNGLNTLFVFEHNGAIKVNVEPFTELDAAGINALPNLCYPANTGADLDGDATNAPFENVPGFVKVTLPAAASGQPAGVAFSVLFPGDEDENGMMPSDSEGVTLMAKDRGK